MDKYDEEMEDIEADKAEVGAIRKAQQQEIEDAIADMNKKDAAWQKKIAQEKAEYAAAAKAYDEIMKELHETEAKLEAAAKTLKTYRRPPLVDNNGGVYNVPDKSFAESTRLCVLAVVA